MRFLLALLLLSGCSSSTEVNVPLTQGDSGAESEASVPVGGECTESSQCEPTAWPGIVDPEVTCHERRCTFACAGQRALIEKCQELGGDCQLDGGCVFP